jgi:hypothetical protein
MPAIASTSGRLHSEFIRLLFLQVHRETDNFFAASGVPLVQSTSGGFFHYRRAAFFTNLKSKSGNLLTNLNLDGAPITTPIKCAHSTSLCVSVSVQHPYQRDSRGNCVGQQTHNKNYTTMTQSLDVILSSSLTPHSLLSHVTGLCARPVIRSVTGPYRCTTSPVRVGTGEPFHRVEPVPVRGFTGTGWSVQQMTTSGMQTVMMQKSQNEECWTLSPNPTNTHSV